MTRWSSPAHCFGVALLCTFLVILDCELGMARGRQTDVTSKSLLEGLPGAKHLGPGI